MKQELPLVSIVTPSYNKGAFIEETILSIKNQTYPRIEHIVIDGGSTDNTIEILKKYKGTYIMQWISEPDQGGADAINKGWRMSHGQILAYLHADDTYIPNAVEVAVQFLSEHPEVSMVYGDSTVIDEHNRLLYFYRSRQFNLKELVCGISMPPPTLILRREVLSEAGYLDTDLYGWDYYFWLRVGLRLKVQQIPYLLTNYRHYPGTKSSSESYRFYPEYLYMLDKIFTNYALPDEIKSVRNQAYSYAHLRIGLQYLGQHQWEQALKHLMKSAILYPPHLTKALLLPKVAISFVRKKVRQMTT